jgi:hypothetical protein
MIPVIASGFDAGAAAFVKSLGGSSGGSFGRRAALLLPADLSKRGWRFHPRDLDRSVAVVSGDAVPCSAITGVLTLLPRIDERELLHIVEEDRRYVAAEMTAFLLAWLSLLPASVPVINRPQPGCLTGPPWSPSRWTQEAARAGFRISASRQPVSPLTVAAGQPVGGADAATARSARNLAAAAGVDVLSLYLDSQSAFVAVSHRPFLDQSGVAMALQDRLQQRAG